MHIRLRDSITHQFAYAPAQRRNRLSLEPRIELEPCGIARAGMRQGQYAGVEVFAPCLYRCGERALASLAQDAAYRVAADCQRQLDVFPTRHQLRVPQGRAFRPRREIPRSALAGKAE